MIDIQEKKKNIILFLEKNGPSLPVQVAREIQMDPVFASAILSELLDAKQIKLSHMKIGSSPLYILPGQEQKLEEQVDNLKPAEKEAYLKLKEKMIIKDEEESPIIRVALRNIKDFATPFKFQEKIMWKYAFITEEKIQEILLPKIKEEKIQKENPKIWETKTEESEQKEESSKKIENIFTKEKKTEVKPNKSKTFLKQVEEFLENKNTKIISIQEVDKKKVIAKTESKMGKSMLFAFNKKKITEEELIKCYRQSNALNLPYHIIISGDLTKKMNEIINTYKKLLKIEKITAEQQK